MSAPDPSKASKASNASNASNAMPQAVTLAAHYDDGEGARHFELAPLEPLDQLGQQRPPASVVPGQFFMLSVPGHGEAAFTYVRAPDSRGHFQALVRRVGALTSRLFELEPGAVLGVRGPFGQGWPMQQLSGKRVLVLAGGCGLAPLALAIDQLSAEPSTRVALIYGSRTPTAQVLSRERTRWSGMLPLLETFDLPDSPERIRGTPLVRLREGLEALGGGADGALVCGPELMMSRVAVALCAAGLSPERIWLSLERRMHCGVGLCGHCYLGASYVCRDGPTYRLDVLRRLQANSPVRPDEFTDIHHC